MVVILYFYSASSLKRVSLFLVLVAALFSLAGLALAGETVPLAPEASVVANFNDTPQPTRKILIESIIVVVKSDFLEKLEINWEGGYLDGLADGSGRLAFGHLNTVANRRLFSPHQEHWVTDRDRRSISFSRRMAASGQTISILWGEWSRPTAANIAPQQVVEKVLKEVIMELKITPHFEENDQFVTLDLELKNDTADATLSGDEPSSDPKQAKIKLRVKDGNSVAIGGLMTDSQMTGTGWLPLLGWLFPDNTSAKSEYELLLIITANIVPVAS